MQNDMKEEEEEEEEEEEVCVKHLRPTLPRSVVLLSSGVICGSP
jgi:hypothetical protein